MSTSGKRKSQALILLFIGLFLLLNFPLLGIANHSQFFLGVPLLYAYIFGVWAIGILLMYRIIKKYTQRPPHE